MLVLARKPGESIVLSNGVKITVLRINSHVVRVGIEAPPNIAIVREELIKDKTEEQRVKG